MRARNIKPGFFKNEVLAEMDAETRLLFIGLWTLADREGRLEDRPLRIKGELFPYHSVDVGSMLESLVRGGFILRYEVGSERLIQIENFLKHQDPHYRERKSELPPAPGRADGVIATGVTRTQRSRILERDGHKCRQCGSTKHLCIDHIIPVSKGGDSSDENLQTLCLSCNTSKGNKLNHRFNVESSSTEPSSGVPSDSGFSDSLIPDSLNPDSHVVRAPEPNESLDGEVEFRKLLTVHPKPEDDHATMQVFHDRVMRNSIDAKIPEAEVLAKLHEKAALYRRMADEGMLDFVYPMGAWLRKGICNYDPDRWKGKGNGNHTRNSTGRSAADILREREESTRRSTDELRRAGILGAHG